MILAILLTTIVYLILQRIDDNRREKNLQPPASWGSRIGLLFFVAIVCYIGVFLLENAKDDNPTNKLAFVEGGKYEETMIQSIQEPIHVGLPPF